MPKIVRDFITLAFDEHGQGQITLKKDTEVKVLAQHGSVITCAIHSDVHKIICSVPADLIVQSDTEEEEAAAEEEADKSYEEQEKKEITEELGELGDEETVEPTTPKTPAELAEEDLLTVQSPTKVEFISVMEDDVIQFAEQLPEDVRNAVLPAALTNPVVKEEISNLGLTEEIAQHVLRAMPSMGISIGELADRFVIIESKKYFLGEGAAMYSQKLQQWVDPFWTPIYGWVLVDLSDGSHYQVGSPTEAESIAAQLVDGEKVQPPETKPTSIQVGEYKVIEVPNPAGKGTIFLVQDQTDTTVHTAPSYARAVDWVTGKTQEDMQKKQKDARYIPINKALMLKEFWEGPVPMGRVQRKLYQVLYSDKTPVMRMGKEVYFESKDDALSAIPTIGRGIAADKDKPEGKKIYSAEEEVPQWKQWIKDELEGMNADLSADSWAKLEREMGTSTQVDNPTYVSRRMQVYLNEERLKKREKPSKESGKSTPDKDAITTYIDMVREYADQIQKLNALRRVEGLSGSQEGIFKQAETDYTTLYEGELKSLDKKLAAAHASLQKMDSQVTNEGGVTIDPETQQAITIAAEGLAAALPKLVEVVAAYERVKLTAEKYQEEDFDKSLAEGAFHPPTYMELWDLMPEEDRALLEEVKLTTLRYKPIIDELSQSGATLANWLQSEEAKKVPMEVRNAIARDIEYTKSTRSWFQEAGLDIKEDIIKSVRINDQRNERGKDIKGFLPGLKTKIANYLTEHDLLNRLRDTLAADLQLLEEQLGLAIDRKAAISPEVELPMQSLIKSIPWITYEQWAEIYGQRRDELAKILKGVQEGRDGGMALSQGQEALEKYLKGE